MIILNEVTLNNVVTYLNQSFKFEPGLTLVKGENRAGKSLLFSSLANLLYYSHPLADKKDPKSILTSKQSSVTDTKKQALESSIILQVQNSKTPDITYSIKQKNNKDSVTYQIKENNVDLDARTIALAKTLIETIYNQPEDIFFTSTYLTSYRNHPLLHGSTSQRYEFFEKLFNFEFFDYVYKHVTDEIKVLEQKQIELTNLKSLVVELPTKTLQLQTAVTELTTLNNRRKSIEVSLSVFTQLRVELLRLLDANDYYKAELATLQKLIDNNTSIWSTYESMAKVDLITRLQDDCQVEELNYNLLIEQERNKQYFDSLQQSYFKDLESLQQATKLYEQIDVSALQGTTKFTFTTTDDLSALQNHTNNLNQIIATNKTILQNKTLTEWINIINNTTLNYNNKFQSLVSLEQFQTFSSANDLEQFQTLVNDLTTDINTKQYQLNEATKKLNAIDNLINKQSDTSAHIDTIQCPTCFSNLDQAQLQTYKIQLQTEVTQLKLDITKVTANINLIKDVIVSKMQLNSLPNLASLEIADSEIKDAQTLNVILINLIKTKQLVMQQESALNMSKGRLDQFSTSNPTPNSTSSIKAVDVRVKIDILKEFLKVFEALRTKEQKVITKLADLNNFITEQHSLLSMMSNKINNDNIAEVTPKIQASLEAKIAQLTKENTDMQSSITKYSTMEVLLAKEIEQLKSYKVKIEQLELQCSKTALFQKLAEVFQPKGFRLEKIKYFTKVFESVLNKFSKFVFMEPFSFEVIIEKRDLQILATRNERNSDVRYLSGSESRCFQLLCLISILALLPQTKRTNVCILDEMDAGCDEMTTKMFYESFLPELRNIVPSVIVITPLKDSGFYINEDRSYIIKKVNGESTINLITSKT